MTFFLAMLSAGFLGSFFSDSQLKIPKHVHTLSDSSTKIPLG